MHFLCMGKKKRLKTMRRHQSPPGGAEPPEPALPELQALMPGPAPSAEELDAIQKAFQKNLRNSPLWDRMVQEFGAAKAEELLGQVGVRVDPAAHGG